MPTLYITYCSDTLAFLNEVKSIRPDLVILNADGTESIAGVVKIPTCRNGLETVCVVRDPPTEMAQLTTLQLLGEFCGSLPACAPDQNTQAWFASKFYTAADQATYERVSGVMIPIPDGSGGTFLPPYMLGVC